MSFFSVSAHCHRTLSAQFRHLAILKRAQNWAAAQWGQTGIRDLRPKEPTRSRAFCPLIPNPGLTPRPRRTLSCPPSADSDYGRRIGSNIPGRRLRKRLEIEAVVSLHDEDALGRAARSSPPISSSISSWCST